ncbi:MAG: TA system VapC family ribonuclease toxin [Actinomycetota bacterium]
MSSTVDVNVLLYASDSSSRFHEGARALVERLVLGPDLFYLFWPVVMGYLRIATHPAIFAQPLRPDEATANIEELLAPPHARTAAEDEGFWEFYRAATAGAPVRGNLVSDAHLVALMRQHGVTTLWTHDRDFRKFDAIQVRDPYAR